MAPFFRWREPLCHLVAMVAAPTAIPQARNPHRHSVWPEKDGKDPQGQTETVKAVSDSRGRARQTESRTRKGKHCREAGGDPQGQAFSTG